MTRRFAVLLVIATAGTGCTAAAVAAGRISLTVPKSIGASPGRVVALTGTVTGAPGGARVALQVRAHDRWRTLARVPIRDGRFQLRWRAPTSLAGALRFAVIERGRLLRAARPVRLKLGDAPVLCEFALMPSSPPGLGVIVGEIVTPGGEGPVCGVGSPSTVQLEDVTGAVIAQETIAGWQSFEFIVRPGSYTVVWGQNGECRGSGVAAAERVIHADAVCPTVTGASSARPGASRQPHR